MTDDVIAHLYGKPISQIPEGLFISPHSLNVILQDFEGPLDLLLYLIRKQNIDILKIPMLLITNQYLNYIEQMPVDNVDLMSDYLLMAALLIEIKTRVLLPQVFQEEEEEEDAEDPRALLVEKLLNYEKMKIAAEKLNELNQEGRDFIWSYLPYETKINTHQPKVDIVFLKEAWLNILTRSMQFRQHEISEENISVQGQIKVLLNQLKLKNQVPFTSLFDIQQDPKIVVLTFLATLELLKEGTITAWQKKPFSEIYIEKKDKYISSSS